MSMRGKALRTGDLVLAACVLLLAALVAAPYLLAPSRTLTCEIRQAGEVIRRVRLADGYTDTIRVETEVGYNVIEIDGRSVRISQADCHDQVCVRTGTLTRAGQAAVCLPNQLIVKLIGSGDDSGVDAIVQ